jgi:hypothetical protein
LGTPIECLDDIPQGSILLDYLICTVFHIIAITSQ